jgi:hypothetical protein
MCVSWESGKSRKSGQSGKSRKSGQSGKSKEVFENLMRSIRLIRVQTVLNIRLLRVVPAEKTFVGQWDMGQNETVNYYKHMG